MSKKLFKEVHDKILGGFKEKGVTPIDVQLGNGYFVFDMGENSVMHFRIKENPNWKFGVWLAYNKAEKPYTEDSKETFYIDVFAQYIDLIDKFKPSRSTFVYSDVISLEPVRRKKDRVVRYFKKDDISSLYGLTNTFEMIWKHKHIAFWRETHGSLDKYYVTKTRAFFYHMVWLFNHWLDNREIKRNIKEQFRAAHRFMKKNGISKNNYEMRDGNFDGWISSPRYQVVVYFDEDVSDERLYQLEDEWEYIQNKIRDKRKRAKYSGEDISDWIKFWVPEEKLNEDS